MKTHDIHAGWLMDGTGNPAQRRMLIRVNGHTVDSVVPFTGITRGDAVLDLSGYTVIPCLMDSHVHLAWSHSGDPQIRQRQIAGDAVHARETIRSNLVRHLASGVVAVRDAGDQPGHTLQYKRHSLRKDEAGICIRCAGTAWYKSGRYGRIIGAPVQDHHELAEKIEAAGDIDQVKLVQSGLNSMKRFGRQTPAQFTSEELQQAVTAASARNLPTMVHANGEMPIRIAIEAGCNSIEHGFFMGKDNLSRMADNATVWVPTAVTMKAYADGFPSGSIESQTATRNLDHQLEQIQFANSAGVRMAVGTDAGTRGIPHGRSVLQEMALLVEGGLSIEQAVRSAARIPSVLMGLDRLGTIAQGKDADFIAVRGEPSRLLVSAASGIRVFIGGQERRSA
ncbi:MAG: amidohydrolase family protein [Desulfobacteraceae bacterium]|nr:amidohydrolase family protein [Desulfobacteraceae bacterium]